MGEITIVYQDLLMAAEKISSASDELLLYERNIQRKICNPLNSLKDEDDGVGYLSTAVSLANAKMELLRQKEERFENFSKAVRNLYEKTQEVDCQVAKKIRSLAEPYEAEIGFFSKVGNFFHCLLIDASCFLDDKIPDFDIFFTSWIRKGVSWISNAIETAHDFFKNGNGQYIANIVDSVLGVFGVAGSAAAIIALAPAMPALAVIGVIFLGVALLYGFADMAVTVEANMKALELELNGNRSSDKSLARYYGGINSVTEYVKRKDFGNEQENYIWETIAETGEEVGQFSKFILAALDITAGLTSMGKVISKDGKTVIGYDYSPENVQKNMKDILKDNGINIISDAKGNENVKIDFIKMFKGSDDAPQYEADKMLEEISGWKTGTEVITGRHSIFSIGEYFRKLEQKKYDSIGEFLDASYDTLDNIISLELDYVPMGKLKTPFWSFQSEAVELAKTVFG